MATRFELLLVPPGGDPARARAIGEEALREIARFDARLSRFRPCSEVAAINAAASSRPVKVEPVLFSLLRDCVDLSVATGGAFDITLGPLTQLWKGASAVPSAAAIDEARRQSGYRHIVLDEDDQTIRFARPGMSIDLGAAGKGYAIDRAIDVLVEHGVTAALLHGGTSSIHALGAPRDHDTWRVGWDSGIFDLRDSALSVSSVRHDAHVIDPRTGWPTEDSLSAVVTGPASFECDALSTALLVLGAGWVPTLRARFPGYDGRVNSAASCRA